MKFTYETIQTLYGYNDDGTQVALQRGDEVYLKLDWANMDLSFPDEWIQKYPDGWVKGTIYSITPTGKKINFKVEPYTYFALYHKNILAVSDKAPN